MEDTLMNWTATLAAAAAFSLASPLSAFAQDNPEMVGITSQDVLPATATNAAGDPITYPTGAAEISSWIATVEPGGHSALHQHPVPIYVYVMEGEFEVQVDGAERISMPQGQGVIEPQNRNMQVFNVGDGPGKLLVVAMGATGQPNQAEPQ
jgi:quercetin dioxygenase-like cupin family protein